MNTFNRLVMILFLLLLIPLMTVLFVLPHVMMPGVGAWFTGWGEYFSQMEQPWLRLIIGVLLALVCDAIAVLLLVLEVRPQRKRFIRVQDVSGGIAAVSSDSIINQLQYALDPLPGVIKVMPIIRVKKDKVQTVIDVDVNSSVNVPEIAAELMEVAQGVLTGDLGLAVYSDPEVHIKVTENVRRKRTRVKKTQEPSPVPVTPPSLPVPVEQQPEPVSETWRAVEEENVLESRD
ncbi:MAG: hypothetical protein JXA33_22150 [Anaerolineae bacterium]|nr:hypothetical protein [Anaerolineae bacterium]